MARRESGRGGRRVVPGVAALVLARYSRLDGAFCRARQGCPCLWCSVVADLSAGRPVELAGESIYTSLCGRPDHGRYRDLLADDRTWLVVGDTLEVSGLVGG